ncbi:TIGR03936 family radical SAM-associated protein [Candidatus Leptofilum sp.]|uniref:TIGR03936 family radical SAM-associated protein n=1 Tax=Candidatus Leptofilum sp. TaxID=3241576 RepID=UPI003B5A0F02
MQANYVQRLRLIFSKGGAARFISHLDLARTLERALNRAKIPVAYTQGFNRRPRMQMATALPLGYTSEYELADVLLTEKMEPAQVQPQLMAKMAPGIEILSVTDVPVSGASLQSLTQSSTYMATPLEPVDFEQLQTKIAEILAAERVERTRERRGKKKVYDLRPLILNLAANLDEQGQVQIEMNLCLAPSKTGRPDEVLLALGFDPLDVRVHRMGMVLAEEVKK